MAGVSAIVSGVGMVRVDTKTDLAVPRRFQSSFRRWFQWPIATTGLNWITRVTAQCSMAAHGSWVDRPKVSNHPPALRDGLGG